LSQPAKIRQSQNYRERGRRNSPLAVEVDDKKQRLPIKAKGVRLIDENPRVGAEGCLVAICPPSSANGVLLELMQTLELENAY